MDELLAAKSVPHLLLTLVVVMAAHLLKGLVDLVLKLIDRKAQVTDNSVKELTLSVKATNRSINNCFTGLKLLAGEKWPDVKKAIDDSKLDV